MTPDEIAALHEKLDKLNEAFHQYQLECAEKFAKADRQFWALVTLLVGAGILNGATIVSQVVA